MWTETDTNGQRCGTGMAPGIATACAFHLFALADLNSQDVHSKRGYKNIAIDAALGKPEAYGPFLRMMADAHTILQPATDEVAGARERVPKPATFIVSPTAPSTEESSQPPAHPMAPGTLVDANGQEYVSG